MRKILPVILVILSLCAASCDRFGDRLVNWKFYRPVKDPAVKTRTYVYSHKRGDDGRRLHLDVYHSPASTWDGPRPILISVHGGGWNSVADRTVQSQMWMRFFAREGYVCVSIDYREGLERVCKGKDGLTDHSVTSCLDYALGMALEDVFDATAFVVEKIAPKYGADPSKIVIMGGSAGAINSLTAENLICNGDQLAAGHLPEGFNYAGIISNAGAIYKDGTDSVSWERKPCPILFFHGDSDIFVPYGSMGSAGFKEVMDSLRLITDKVKDVYVDESHPSMFWGPAAIIPSLEKVGASYRLFTFPEADHTISMLPCYTDLGRMKTFIEENVLGGIPVQEIVNPANDDGEPRNQKWLLSHIDFLKDFRKLDSVF